MIFILHELQNYKKKKINEAETISNKKNVSSKSQTFQGTYTGTLSVP
jgi:hypothetical protein